MLIVVFCVHVSTFNDWQTTCILSQDAWETARSFVGGLDLSVGLLKSDDLEVSTISLLNLLVIIWQGKLSQLLTPNENEKLINDNKSLVQSQLWKGSLKLKSVTRGET